MIQRTLVSLAAALPLGLGLALAGPSVTTGVAASVQEGELETLVAEEADAASGRSNQELWERARELRGAERLGGEGELDRAIDYHLGRPQTITPQATLLLSASRLQGDSPDPVLLLNALTPLVASPDDDLGRSTAILLGNRVFKGLNRGRRNEIVDKMLAGAEDVSRPPTYRLEYAKSAYRVGAGSARRKAIEVLRTFLESEDAELRAMGALAIAGATDQPVEGRLRQELEQLAEVPDERGALAAAYLSLEDERIYAERKLRDLRKQYQENKLSPEMEEFFSVLNMIQERHLEGDRVKYQDLVDAAVDGMLGWMDPHSNYLNSEVYAKFFQDLEAEYGGIGAYVNEDPDSGLFTIVRPIYSGPAYRAGLQTEDKIVRIGMWPTLGQPETEIIKRLKGKPGTPVELYVWRRGMNPELIDRPTEDMKVTVVREQIEIPAGTYQMLPGQVGLIELTTFSQLSMDQLATWIEDLKKDGMRALILDMRRNNGGLLTEARDVADLFLPEGKVVVSTEGRDRRRESLRTADESLVPEDMPIVILTSRMTASAAEIVSGALQDHGRAQLVGKTTFGKGSVQQLLPILPERQDYWRDENNNNRWDQGESITRDWDDDGEVDYAPRVKLTIARYLLPSGRSIHRELDREGNLVTEGGVAPDHVVDMPLIERWRYEEQVRVRRGEVLRDYVDGYYTEFQELFGRLAVNDEKRPDFYPDFDQLVLQLDTSLSRDDVRRLLRDAIRRRVQDDMGREFPWGDYVEDPQVQTAIEVALSELGESVDDVTEYGLVFDVEPTAEGRDLALVRADSAGSLRRARELLEEARSGGVVLTEESLDELLHLIGELEATEEN